MATRSFIARTLNSGFEGVYCHWNGHPDDNGHVLLQHYDDASKVAELLSHGDISVLRPKIGEKHDPNDHETNWTTFYIRDYGECASACSKRFRNLNDLLDCAFESGCEYLYLFDSEFWDCFDLVSRSFWTSNHCD